VSVSDVGRAPQRRSVVAIGVFDGLHRGHVAVVKRLLDHARVEGVASCVVTFDPHPAYVLGPKNAPRLLATLEQRVEWLRSLGVDQVRVIRFDDERARQSARDFVDAVLVDELGAKVVVVGEDFRFGHDREGSVDLLREVGAANDFDVDAVSLIGDPAKWSSTAVRSALDEGDVEGASAILGRAFAVRGLVVRGDARGRELGFPTANVAISLHQQLPKVGIYAGATFIDARPWPAAISVGRRPQFYENGSILLEVHVVGFDGDLYGQSLEVVFLRHLREESKFESLDDLVAQIGRDVAKTQEIFDSSAVEEPGLLG